MELPEDLRELVDQIGEALVQAVATDPRCRDLARQIHEKGFDIAMIVEANVALHRKVRDEDLELLSVEQADLNRGGMEWSAEDKAFLRTFKISLD